MKTNDREEFFDKFSGGAGYWKQFTIDEDYPTGAITPEEVYAWYLKKQEELKKYYEHDMNIGYSKGWQEACERYGITYDPRIANNAKNKYLDSLK